MASITWLASRSFRSETACYVVLAGTSQLEETATSAWGGKDQVRRLCDATSPADIGPRFDSTGDAAMAGSAGDYFWPGAFATYWSADPKEQMVVVSMMQSPLGRHYAELYRALVYQAIVE